MQLDSAPAGDFQAIAASEWNEFSNVNEVIEQKDFSSIFEFLKAIRFKQKKRKRYDAYKLNAQGGRGQ